MRFLLGRLLQSTFLLIGASFLTFLFSSLAPGNYVDEMRLNPQISPGTLAALRAQYQIEKPLPVRYTRWALSVAHGQFGYSFAYNLPVGSLLWVRARNTLLLTVPATLLVWALALPLGVWSAEKLGRRPEQALSLFVGTLLVVPDLVLALGLLILAARSGRLPTGGLVSLTFEALSFPEKCRDLASHMALPVAALVLSSLPLLLWHTRAAVAEVLEAPFMRAAAAHGLPRRQLLYRYALRAAAHPLISLFGFSIGTLLSGSLSIEIVMSWPGLGPLLLESILARDLYVVIAAVLFSVVFLVLGNFIADVMLYWADPRIRGEAKAV